VLNSGQVQPGDATTVGDLSIAGNFSQAADGSFEVNLGSLSFFDSMDVVGNLALNGTLRVSSLGGYNPVLGDSFVIITFDDGVADASDLTGTFSTLVAIGFHPSVEFGVSYFDHSVVLNVIASSVPEPGVPTALAASGIALAALRRRRGRSR
jgi:hypothetical protein